jgi:proteic killer suppression protein
LVLTDLPSGCRIGLGMDVRFQDATLARLETDPDFLGGWSPAIVKAFRKRMNFIRQAANERDLHAWRSLNVEKLKGDRSHENSMRLNDQWRLIFGLESGSEQKTLVIIAIEDYH